MKTVKDFEKKYPAGTQIDILGAKYALVYGEPEDSNALGVCNWWNKEIRINLSWYKMAEKKGFGSLNRMLQTVRHELVHAFFYELGNMDRGSDEFLADELAIKTHQFVDLMEPFMDVLEGYE